MHKNLPLLLTVLATLLASVPFPALAADVAFFPVESTNLAPEDAIAIGELLAQSYAAASQQAVLAPSRTESAPLAGGYEAAARQLGVAEYVRTNAIAVGSKLVVSATRYQANGAVVYQSKMTADSIEDMTQVSDRMAKALYERVDDEAVRTRENVTLTEARAQNRVWTEKVFGFKTGIHFPFAKNADYVEHLSVSFDGRLEMDRFFLEFGGGLIVPARGEENDDCWFDEGGNCEEDNHGRMGGLTAELGASYFLTRGNVGLYVGGGAIPRLTFVNDVAMMFAYGQVGVTMPRDHSTRFYVDLRIAQALIESELDNGYKRYPTDASVHLGVGW